MSFTDKVTENKKVAMPYLEKVLIITAKEIYLCKLSGGTP